MAKPPVIPQLSSAVPAEVKRAFDALRTFFVGVEKAGGLASRDEVASAATAAAQAVTSPAVSPTTPPVITGFAVTGGFGSIFLSWDLPVYKYFSHVEIWRSTVNDLGQAAKVDTTSATVHTDTPPSASSSVTYYYWVRIVGSPEIYGPYNATAGTPGSTADDPAYVMQLLLGRLGYDQFDAASGVFPVRTVASLPTLPNSKFPVGVLVYLSTDGKLYRNKDGIWTAAVAASDMTGQIVAAQVADSAITTAKFASGIEPVQVVDALPSAAGYAGPKVVLLSTDGKLYRYASGAWTTAVPTTDLSGAISGTQISDGAISTAKLAANSVTANEIAANAVTAGKVAAGAISTDQLAANAITTAKLAANAVTANEIAANAITAGKIAAGTVDANAIAANSIIAGKIAAGAIVAGDGVISNAAIGTAHIIDAAITNAKIGSVATDKITAGTALLGSAVIADGAITNAKIGSVIQSTTYVPGSSGWTINKNGTVEFNGGTFRGSVVFTGSSSGYSNLSDKPTNLSGINSTEGTKLTGIETGATVGATAGSNLKSSTGTTLSDAAIITSQGTAADTAAVAGTSAAAVRDNAASGASAANTVTGWTKTGTTKIDGGVIATDTAFIYTAMIYDAQITNLKLANLAVDSAKIANLAVTTGKIANLAVDTLQIADWAVTSPVSAYTEATVALSSGATVTVQTAPAVDSATKKAIIILSFVASAMTITAGQTWYVKLYRGSTEIYNCSYVNSTVFGSQCFVFTDESPGGAAVYTAKIVCGSGQTGNIGSRSLTVIGAMK